MKNKPLFIGLLCLVLFLLAVKWRKHVVIKQRNAPIVSFVKEWEETGKPVVVQTVKKSDVPIYTKVTSWKVEPNVFEGHVSKTVRDQLHVGQEMIFQVDGSTFQGKITKVAEDLSLETGMFPVYVEFQQEFDVPRWLVALAHTDTMRNVIHVDDEVADYRGGTYYVWIVEDGQARQREIALLSRNGYGLIVQSGLEEGESLVIEGHSKLREGDKVKVLETRGGPKP